MSTIVSYAVNKRKGAPLAVGLVAAFALLYWFFCGSAAGALSLVYTTDSDFDLGTLTSVNYDVPDQLQLDTTVGGSFPFLWIANAGEDSVSKIDTATGDEVARYRVWFGALGVHSAYAGPAPSRTAVDSDGNVYVASRHFDSRRPQVMKILSTGGIDRNSNAVIDTSSDASADGVIQVGEMAAVMVDDGDGILETAELTDERIAWAAQYGVAGKVDSLVKTPRPPGAMGG